MDIQRRSRTAVSNSQWELGWTNRCEDEGRKLLTAEQYAHLIQQFEDLATQEDPRKSSTQDVRAIEDLFELRDKGGLFGRMNVRVYFGILDEPRLIVCLACVKKESDGQTPTHIKIRIRQRWRAVKQELEKGRRPPNG